jgi:hypothetical protein
MGFESLQTSELICHNLRGMRDVNTTEATFYSRREKYILYALQQLGCSCHV